MPFSISNNVPEWPKNETEQIQQKTVVQNTAFEMKWDIAAVQNCSQQQ